MNKSFDREFFRRFIDGGCSDGERAEFLRWLEAVDKKDEISWMKEQWDQPFDSERKILGAEERILANLLQRIKTDLGETRQKETTRNPFLLKKDLWLRYSMLRYASVILMVLVPIVIYSSIFGISSSPTKITYSYAEKATHNGQHLSFRLDDGSMVTLNSNSSLTYPVTFSDSDRVVTLSGEAFFDIAKDARRPFRVTTGNVTTTALGTSFNIDFPDMEEAAEISLLSGTVEVAVRGSDETVKKLILEPGEQVSIFSADSVSDVARFDPLEISGWKDGVIYFKEAKLSRIVEVLETWYDVKLTVVDNDGKSKNWTYTGQFGNQTLENVLRGIGYVKGFESTIEGKKATIIFN